MATAALVALYPGRLAPKAVAHRVWVIGPALVASLLAFSPSLPIGSPAASVPVSAFNYLENHPGRVLTTYEWSGYGVLRGHRSFVDGRTDFFVGPLLTESLALQDLKHDPLPLFKRYHVRYVVWSLSAPLGVYLQASPHATLVYRHNGDGVFRLANPY
jgi:hypothetical protein